MSALQPALPLADLLGLFGHFLLLSLLAVGGAITTAPDMHRYIVAEHQWISGAQFTSSIALAQAAPGPNVLFVAQTMYYERAFDRLPALVDALIDASCDNQVILEHCRNVGPHVRGCWVVDLVLGKE